MRFGLGVPTGTEGMMYPVPYADPEDAIRISVEAERLGFDSVWGNDHVSTQAYVREEFADPPRFYDPYVYLSYLAAETTSLRLATAITVMAFRHPVVVAKMAATLDQLSGGRFMLGVGIGAYREETEALYPGTTIHRGRHAEEFLQALTPLFTERRASFEGEFVSFRDVENFPKPRQATLPVLSGGNAVGSRERAARYATGWLPACLNAEELRTGVDHIHAEAERIGRTLPADFDIAPQYSVSIGATREQAMERFTGTQLYKHMVSLSQSTLKGRQSGVAERNLIGSADDICERVEQFRDAGATTMAGLYFAANTVEETLEIMQEFSENVIARFRSPLVADALATAGAGDEVR